MGGLEVNHGLGASHCQRFKTVMCENLKNIAFFLTLVCLAGARYHMFRVDLITSLRCVSCKCQLASTITQLPAGSATALWWSCECWEQQADASFSLSHVRVVTLTNTTNPVLITQVFIWLSCFEDPQLKLNRYNACAQLRLDSLS